jgi:hypothetical protein
MLIRIFLVLLFYDLIAPIGLSAQAFTQIYRPLGESSELYFGKITPTSDDGFFAAGDFADILKVLIARLDAKGKPVWVKIPEGQRALTDIIALKDGSLLVFNNNRSYQGGVDASVLHLGSDGRFVDEIIWGTTETADILGRAVRLASGEVLATGTTTSKQGEKGHMFLVKFSEQGKVLWSKTMSLALGFGSFSNLTEASDGGFYATAQRLGPTSTTLWRFDADGNLLWGKSYDFGLNPGNIWLNHGLRYADGALLFSFATGDSRIVSTKMDADGNPLWVRAFSGPNNLSITGAGLTSNQTAVISGATEIQLTGDNNNFILRVAPDGKMLGVMAHGSPVRDSPLDSYLAGEYMISCGTTLDGAPDGAAQNTPRAFIGKSHLNSSGCLKNFALTESATPVLPTVSNIILTPSTPPDFKTLTTTVADFSLSVQTTCQSVGVEDEAPCPGLEPDVLQAAAKNFHALLIEKVTLADDAHLRVFDCTGKMVLETRGLEATGRPVFHEKNMPLGLYFYSLELKACNRTIRVAGKTAFLSH